MALAVFEDRSVKHLLVAVGVRFGDVVRDVEQRGALVIVRRAKLHLVRFVRAERVAQILEFAVRGQGGGGKDHGALLDATDIFQPAKPR